MNLDNLNFVELNAQEVQEIQGGDIGKTIVKYGKQAWVHVSDFCVGVWDGIVN
jgi:hypothetical protein